MARGLEEKIQALIARCWMDEEFKERFVRDPKAVIAEVLMDLPPNAELIVLQDTKDKRHFVLPEAPAEGFSLSDAGEAARRVMGYLGAGPHEPSPRVMPLYCPDAGVIPFYCDPEKPQHHGNVTVAVDHERAGAVPLYCDKPKSMPLYCPDAGVIPFYCDPDKPKHHGNVNITVDHELTRHGAVPLYCEPDPPNKKEEK